MDNSTLQKEIVNLKQSIEKLKLDYSKHQHDNVDGTKILKKDIELEVGQFLSVGYGGQGSAPVQNLGTVNEQMQYSMALSKDNRKGFVNKLNALQLNFLHQPNNISKQSFVTSFRGPLVSTLPGTTISTTITESTITIDGFNFEPDELSGALINIYDSSVSLVESQIIASNTSNIITISGTWLSTTTNGFFDIYVPVFFGSSQYIWQRVYVNEGTGGGIRFGVGPTNGGQNVLLYTDTSGNLMIRDKVGNSNKIGVYSGNVTYSGGAGNIFPSGWTVSNLSAGSYRVTHNLGTTNYSVVVSPYNVYVSAVAQSSNYFDVSTMTVGGTPTNAPFNFLLSQ